MEVNCILLDILFISQRETLLTLSEKHIATIKDASKKLTGSKRRAFQAQVTLDYLESNARLAERVFGWDRNTVDLGLHELRTGITCAGDFKARGNKKMEEKSQPLKIRETELSEVMIFSPW